MDSLVETITKMVIKPSSPTPQSLSSLTLSSTDQLMPLMHLSLSFFYPNHSLDSTLISLQLRNSLAKTLVSYYPFAGQLVENDHIHCNDQGVEILEVLIHCQLDDILQQKTKSHSQDLVYPLHLVSHKSVSLAVQLSHFDCGGVAIALSISHKVADAATLFSFMNDWAATTRLSTHVPTPVFVSDSLFPQQRDIPLGPYISFQNSVTRRFVFPPQEIDRLKSKAVESGIERPTRVEVVTALLYQSVLVSTNAAGLPSGISLSVNLRSFLGHTNNSVGNIVSFLFATNADDARDFSALIGLLREEKKKLKKFSKEKLSYGSKLKEVEEEMKSKSEGFEFYMCTSWCGFPVYDVDFGLGKPSLVSLLSDLKNVFILMDSASGGVEALITLEEDKMSAFENNEDLLSFASLCSPN